MSVRITNRNNQRFFVLDKDIKECKKAKFELLCKNARGKIKVFAVLYNL